jgi:SsrA-binding protein
MAGTEKAKGPHRHSVAVNRKARHEFHIDEKLEAGLVLQGSEVKALREARLSFGDAWVRIEHGAAWLVDLHISPYEQANRMNHEPLRPRKLLLHKAEIRRLVGKVSQEGFTLVPLELYFLDGWAKVEVGVARGKKLHDKRQDQREREAKREMDRARKR